MWCELQKCFTLACSWGKNPAAAVEEIIFTLENWTSYNCWGSVRLKNPNKFRPRVYVSVANHAVVRRTFLCMNFENLPGRQFFFLFISAFTHGLPKKVSRQSTRIQNANVNTKFNSKRKVGYTVVAQVWVFPTAMTVFYPHVLNEPKYSQISFFFNVFWMVTN